MRIRVVAGLGWLALSVGCSGAHFDVHVRDARTPMPVRDASVLLFDVVDDLCVADPSGGQLSDASGNAQVEARWCGAARLVVVAQDYAPVTREIDSCETQAVAVELSRWQPEPTGVDDPRTVTARRFLAALLSNDRTRIESLLADPHTAESYFGGGVATRGEPAAMRFVELRSTDSNQVEAAFDFYYDTGCRESWLVHVVGDGDAARVSTVTLVDSRGD